MKIFALFAGVFSAAILFAKRGVKTSAFTVPFTPDIDNTKTTVDFVPQGSDFKISIPDVLVGPIEKLNETVQTVSRFVFGTQYDALIIESAERYGISPAILYKLLNQESRFREDIIFGRVKSSVGALGIAQFMPATAIQELGSINAALDPERAIPGAARYLAKLIRQTGSLAAGVAAYNWGVGNVTRKGLKKAPRETIDYVATIVGVDITKA